MLLQRISMPGRNLKFYNRKVLNSPRSVRPFLFYDRVTLHTKLSHIIVLVFKHFEVSTLLYQFKRLIQKCASDRTYLFIKQLRWLSSAGEKCTMRSPQYTFTVLITGLALFVMIFMLSNLPSLSFLLISPINYQIILETHMKPFLAAQKTNMVTNGNEDNNMDLKEISMELEYADFNTSSEEVSCKGNYDLYHGKWVYDNMGPLYNSSCPVINPEENCQGNGRPDNDYENWRWQPEHCRLPRFNAKRFLELMRGKTLAFVGDSLARNQMESLLCMLWQIETPVNRGNRRMLRWRFRSTKTTIILKWSSWLVHKSYSGDASHPSTVPAGIVGLHLDLPDKEFTEILPMSDIIVLNYGHWFTRQSAYILNGSIVGGQQWSPERGTETQVSNTEAFAKSIETTLTAIANHPKFSGLVVVSSYSPDHYEGGMWNTGGSCAGKVKPASVPVRSDVAEAMREELVKGLRRAEKNSGSDSALMMVFMDITEPFQYRHDGHPGPYRGSNMRKKKIVKGGIGNSQAQDCVHWCMPGPVDAWNEILLEIIERR